MRAQRVIYAAPLFTAAHVLSPALTPAEAPWLTKLEYSPWLVANLHLRRVPREGTPRCDNVLYQPSPSLGYTLAT